MRRDYVDIREGQLHYRHGGNGPAVICLHMSGSSSQEYDAIGDMLSGSFSVYAPDLLGFGGSDRPPRLYSLEEHAETVLEFMDALGIERAYLIGNLVGCNIAAHFAVHHPDRTLGLMLGQYCFDTDYRRFLSRHDDPCFLPITPKADGSHLLEMWGRAARYPEPPEIIDARALCLHQAGDGGEYLHLALFSDRDFAEILPLIRVKTVVVAYGGFPECGNEVHVAGMIPGAVLDELPGATPYVTRSHPKAVADMFTKHFC